MSSLRLEAVVFDMDGVLVDSEVHWRTVESDFLGQVIPHWDDALQSSILGMSAYDVHAYLVAEHGLLLSRAEYLAHYNSLSEDIYGRRVSLIPGVCSLMERVADADIRIGVASSSPRPWIEIVMDRFSLHEIVGAIVSADEVAGKGKPDPEIYHKALRALGVTATTTVAIEDTHKGLTSAKGAGIACVGFRNGFNFAQDLSEADLVVDDFDSLSITMLEQLIGER
jgi:HAD superfamily hydrolase (TIGR01509 family)